MALYLIDTDKVKIKLFNEIIEKDNNNQKGRSDWELADEFNNVVAMCEKHGVEVDGDLMRAANSLKSMSKSLSAHVRGWMAGEEEPEEDDEEDDVIPMDEEEVEYDKDDE